MIGDYSRSKLLVASAMLAAVAGSMSMSPAGGQGGFSLSSAEQAALKHIQIGDRTSSPRPGDSKTNRLRSSWARNSNSGRRRGPGWTVRHAKRVAKKARNVRRFRKGQRGS